MDAVTQNITYQIYNSNNKNDLNIAPAANKYYQQIGFTSNERCWVLNRDESINT